MSGKKYDTYKEDHFQSFKDKTEERLTATVAKPSFATDRIEYLLWVVIRLLAHGLPWHAIYGVICPAEDEQDE